jgi:putative salt-induced outer membrane protein YdiY
MIRALTISSLCALKGSIMFRISLTLLVTLFSLTLFADDEKELGWVNSSELGYVVTGGNSQAETTSFRQTTKYQRPWDVFQLTGHYIQSSGQVLAPTPGDPNARSSQTTAENWAATLRWEKIFRPKWFNGYVAYGWRGDRFQGVREGQDADIGLKYFTANKKTFKQFFELGYRYTRELLLSAPTQEERVGVGSLLHPEYHYGRVKAQADYVYSKSFELGAWVEYLASVTDWSDDQRINFSPYITSVLTDMFSLKVSYESRYRFRLAPGATAYTDFTFTTALLAKF